MTKKEKTLITIILAILILSGIFGIAYVSVYGQSNEATVSNYEREIEMRDRGDRPEMQREVIGKPVSHKYRDYSIRADTVLTLDVGGLLDHYEAYEAECAKTLIEYECTRHHCSDEKEGICFHPVFTIPHKHELPTEPTFTGFMEYLKRRQ